MCLPRRCWIRWRITWICAQPFDRKGRAAPGSRGHASATGVGLSDLAYFDNMLVADRAMRGEAKHRIHAEACSTRRRCSATDAVCGFVGRNAALEHGREPGDLFEEVFVPLLKEAKARGPHLPGGAVPDAGLGGYGGPLAQPDRLRAGAVDRAAPHLREARRGRSVPHPLRSVARDPDGPGHALGVPVPEGRGVRLPDRRLPREGAGGSIARGVSRPGGTAGRRCSAATGSDGASRARSPADHGQRLEEAGGAVPSTSCRARRATIRSPTCRTAASTGWTTSSRRASCSTSMRGRRMAGGGARVPARPDPGSRPGSRRSSPARSRSRGRSMPRPPRCTPCSTRCSPSQGIPGAGRRPGGVPLMSRPESISADCASASSAAGAGHSSVHRASHRGRARRRGAAWSPGRCRRTQPRHAASAADWRLDALLRTPSKSHGAGGEEASARRHRLRDRRDAQSPASARWRSAFLDAGIHVMCDKPLALSLEEAG
jgi:hypothetical protein